jgi:hypothetical protein
MNQLTSTSANLLLKGTAVLALFVLPARPSAYMEIWERGNWFVIGLGIVILPLLLRSCARVLVWRVRVGPSIIEIRSMRGVFRRPLADVSRLERSYGRLRIFFRDGVERSVPSLVGDLDLLRAEIVSRSPSLPDESEEQ